MPVQVSDQIDEAARQRFESDWNSGHPQPLGHYLRDSDPAYRLATLEELIQIDMEFRWRRWSTQSQAETVVNADGSTVRPATAPPLVETYLQQFPDLSGSDILQRLVEAEIELRRAKGLPVDPADYQRRFPNQPLPSAWFRTLREETFPQQWGEYTLTARVGQGAMGVVYRAHQAAAHREVALKRILTQRLAEADATWATEIVSRFETEAKAAAQLNHENIVSVYDVGYVEDQPFFAMRLVEGESIAELVRENTLAPARAAAVMKQVAEALAHAHQHGVLHRDIKPANILLETSSGKVLVTDFGLAKWELTDQTITQTGQLVGTPAYMPPEQARDPRQTSERSDVYAMGATLYHLLTGRPPFQASSMVEQMRLLLHEEPLAPRKLSPEIPRDLETICLQCLHKEPERRYQSAQEVADDLQRFLEHRPVLARPISTLERAVRWCRRNRTLAIVGSLALLLGLAAFGATIAGLAITREKNVKLEATNRLGTSAVNDLITELSESVLLGLPSMQPERNRLLLKARDYHVSFAALRGEDPGSLADVAVSELMVGQIAALVGNPDDGLQQFEKATALFARLPASEQQQKRIRIAAGDAWNATGQARAHQKKFAEAETAFAKAEQVRQALVNDFPKETQIARKLFNVQMNRGIIALRTGDLKRAERLERQAQQNRADWLENDNDQLLRRDYSIGQYNLAKIADMTEKPDEAKRLLRDAIERLSRLIETSPLDIDLRWQRVLCRRLLGQVYLVIGEQELAIEELIALIPEVEQIVLENPSVPDYKREGAKVLIETGFSVAQLGDAVSAEACLQSSTDWLALLSPDDPRVRYLEASNLCLQGAISLLQNQGAEALNSHQEAVDLLTDLIADNPEEPLYRLKRDEILELLIVLKQMLQPQEPSQGYQ